MYTAYATHISRFYFIQTEPDSKGFSLCYFCFGGYLPNSTKLIAKLILKMQILKEGLALILKAVS